MRTLILVSRYTGMSVKDLLEIPEGMFVALANAVQEVAKEDLEYDAAAVALGIAKAFGKGR